MKLAPPLASLTVTSPFGKSRDVDGDGTFKTHNGTDFRAREPTAIYAAAHAIVERAAMAAANGLHIILSTADGWRIFYLHLSQIDVNEGDEVHPGQYMGLTGNTGASAAPHLHFEVHDPQGRPVDPMGLIGGGGAALVAVAVAAKLLLT